MSRNAVAATYIVEELDLHSTDYRFFGGLVRASLAMAARSPRR
jgi:hypothetical protein